MAEAVKVKIKTKKKHEKKILSTPAVSLEPSPFKEHCDFTNVHFERNVDAKYLSKSINESGKCISETKNVEGNKSLAHNLTYDSDITEINNELRQRITLMETQEADTEVINDDNPSRIQSEDAVLNINNRPLEFLDRSDVTEGATFMDYAKRKDIRDVCDVDQGFDCMTVDNGATVAIKDLEDRDVDGCLQDLTVDSDIPVENINRLSVQDVDKYLDGLTVDNGATVAVKDLEHRDVDGCLKDSTVDSDTSVENINNISVQNVEKYSDGLYIDGGVTVAVQDFEVIDVRCVGGSTVNNGPNLKNGNKDVKNNAEILKQTLKPKKCGGEATQKDADRVTKALTLEQLKSVYFNPQLAQNSHFIESFIQHELKQEDHEFYHILHSYHIARNKFIASEKEVCLSQEKYGNLAAQLWLTTQKSVTAEGVCGDERKVSQTHTYESVNINSDVLQSIGQVLQDVRSALVDKFSMFAYAAQLSRLQVESYIHNLFVTSPALREIPRNAPIQAIGRHYRNSGVKAQVEHLRTCITILFMFHRRPSNDEHFVRDIRAWTDRMVGALLRIASFDDHLFLLNHILRCPSGMGTWAAHYIQLTTIPADPTRSTFGGPVLDHIITALSTLFHPIKSRELFMSHMNRALPVSVDPSSLWILVDSDGEEDEDPGNAWLHLHENDVVAVLEQFRMADIFKHIFLVATHSDSVDEACYDARCMSDSLMLKVFAFTACLVGLLETGLQTFNLSRYRQLNKRLGRMVRNVVQYVSEHWHNYSLTHREAPATTQLQIEFDQFFLRSTYAILSAQKLGSWQFMVDMPYYGVSTETMWKLLWLLHQDHSASINIDQIPNDTTNLLLFSDNLMKLPTCESIYLLTVFANMAQERPACERNFIDTVTLGIFEISYMNNHTRDFCSKVGRELLIAMVMHHPFIVSTLLQKVHKYMPEIDQMSLYLYKELPLMDWQPTDDDIVVLRSWLLTYDLSTTENHLARTILTNLNWGFNRLEDALALPLDLHRRVALMLVDACSKYAHGEKFMGYAILKGMKQIGLSVRNLMTNEQLFNVWVWDLVLRLRLHTSSHPKLPLGTCVPADIPSVDRDDHLSVLIQGMSVNSGIACYVTLSMTTFGHSVTDFMSQGLSLLSTLSSQNEHQAVIQLMLRIVPLFCDHQQQAVLTNNLIFQKVFRSLLTADDASYRVNKLLLRDSFPGDHLRLLADMIQTQISTSCAPGEVGGTSVIYFWMSLLLHTSSKWYHDHSCCYLLDNLIKAAFTTKGGIPSIQDFFRSKYTEHIKDSGTSGGLTSIVNWISSGVTLPSYLERTSSEFVWLAYLILDTEGWYENSRGIWRAVQQEMFNDLKLSVDQAVRKAVSHLKLTSAPAPHRMNIYRWAQQAVDTPIEHPLLPIIYQRFFVLYLGRHITDTGLPHRASVGEKFFESMAQVSACKRMKRHLGEAARFYQNTSAGLFLPRLMPSGSPIPNSQSEKSSVVEASPDMSDPTELTDPRLEHTEYVPNKDFYDSLARLYRTFMLWMDEPRLHDPHLYLPSLPPQYDAEKLVSVFHNNTEAWDEFINKEKVEFELVQMVSEWINRNGPSSCYNQRYATSDITQQQSATERMVDRMNKEVLPKPPPPVVSLKPPVPDITLNILTNQDSLMYTLNAGLTTIKDHAQLFSTNTSKHVALDCTYLELLPQQYYNDVTNVVLEMPCRKPFSIKHKCKQPAIKQVQISIKMLNEAVDRHLDENRASYNQMMIEALLPPPQPVCTAAVHIENAITMLVKLSQSVNVAAEDQRKLCNVATVLFYHMASMVNDETNFYSPSLQFFSSCIEILGQTFISHNTAQVQSLLDFALENPSLSELMAPHFIPASSPHNFLSMYERLVTFPNVNDDVVFQLLSKFDVLTWLQSYHPSVADIKCLITVIMTSLSRYVDDTPNPILEMFNSHLKSVLKYDFPVNIDLVLAALLQGSSSSKLSVTCWKGFYETCTAGCVSLPDGSLTPLSLNVLPITQIQHTLEWLSTYFHEMRLSQCNSPLFGLFPTWHVYSHYISLFIHDLCHDLITKVLPNVPEWTPVRAMDYLWQLISSVYQPWIQPLHHPTCIHLPWLEPDSEFAVEFLALFVKNVAHLHQVMQGLCGSYTMDALNHVLRYYMSVLAKKGTPDFILTVYHMRLLKLPWHDLYPPLEVLEMMAKIKEENSIDSFLFLSQLFSRVNWSKVVEDYLTIGDPVLASQVEAALFSMYLQIYAEPDLMEDQEELSNCFLLAEKYNWDYLLSSTFLVAVEALLESCNCQCVLAERASTQSLGLRLIRAASGFSVTGSAKWTRNMSEKRTNYLWCIVHLLSQCSFCSDINVEAIRKTIVNILTDVEAVQAAVADVNIQLEESFEMINHIFSLLNNCNPSGQLLDVVITTITRWLESSPNSILLMPCLKSSSCSLASFKHMTEIAETCLETYFLSPDDTNHGCKSWSAILASLRVPQLNREEYFTEAVTGGSYLILNAYILQQLPLCTSLESEWRLMTYISSWIIAALPKPDHESKLILLVQRYLELLIKQLKFAGNQSNAAKQYNDVLTALVSLGEDRAPKGFLGAIGLGKKSALSRKFRTFTRCLSMFLAHQLVSQDKFRSPSIAVSTMPIARSTKHVLKQTLEHKDYRLYRDPVLFTTNFVATEQHTIHNWFTLLAQLCHDLFPDESFLWVK